MQINIYDYNERSLVCQRYLISWLIDEPKKLCIIQQYITPSDFTDELYSNVYRKVCDGITNDNLNIRSIILSYSNDADQKKVASIFNTTLVFDELIDKEIILKNIIYIVLKNSVDTYVRIKKQKTNKSYIYKTHQLISLTSEISIGIYIKTIQEVNRMDNKIQVSEKKLREVINLFPNASQCAKVCAIKADGTFFKDNYFSGAFSRASNGVAIIDESVVKKIKEVTGRDVELTEEEKNTITAIQKTQDRERDVVLSSNDKYASDLSNIKHYLIQFCDRYKDGENEIFDEVSNISSALNKIADTLRDIKNVLGDTEIQDCTISNMILDMTRDVSTTKEATVASANSLGYINAYTRAIDSNVYYMADYWMNSTKHQLKATATLKKEENSIDDSCVSYDCKC